MSSPQPPQQPATAMVVVAPVTGAAQQPQAGAAPASAQQAVVAVAVTPQPPGVAAAPAPSAAPAAAVVAVQTAPPAQPSAQAQVKAKERPVKAAKAAKGKAPVRPPNALQEDPSIIRSDTPFPHPDLYFRVFDSEKDEPESKIRQDVNKLYDRWMEKYGRRWPDNGLQTEDMVWLKEEAYKKPGSGAPGLSRSEALASGLYRPIEVSEFEDQFIPETDVPEGSDPSAPKQAGGAAGGSAAAGGAGGRSGGASGRGGSGGSAGGGGGAGGSAGGADGSGEGGRRRRPKLSNYEATVAGARWVTDEFESADVEAGNLEQLWGMYLFDEEGKPTFMPARPANEAQGEESEDFADVYSSFRPRYVTSEEAKEAVWVTDEFESEEDNTESEWEPEYVGAGLGLIAEDPLNPQYSLRHSTHPLAPFPGESLKWASYVYPDGTTFEGLTRQSIPHGMGVMTFGTGTGAGFTMEETRIGDKFEGEFQGGYAHGLGQFTSENTGEVHIGEYFAGQRHGCGIKVDMRPFYYLMERGDDPITAYQKTYEDIMRNIEFRTWFRNKPLGDDYEDETLLYSVKEDFGNPYDVIKKNLAHDAKLREWAGLDNADKATHRLETIINRVQNSRRGDKPAYLRADDGTLVPNLDSDGNDTEYDSVDILVGNTTDGGYGPGWDGVTDSSDYPMDARLESLVGLEAAEDRMAENSMKEAILGQKAVNVFNGLDLRTYLEGKEGKHKELVARVGHDMYRKKQFYEEFSLPDNPVLETTEEFVVDERYLSPDLAPQGLKGKTLTSRQQRALLRDMAKKEAEAAEDDPWVKLPSGKDRAPGAEDTDTRFETESEAMELCDIAEILGTVEEAREIVNRARMWRWKPYGEATLQKAQDGNGAPLNLFQDPLHYPHGTKFMAPGPMGQCHGIPEDEALRSEMAKVAHNYGVLHQMYNFDWDPEPGSVQYMIDNRIMRADELQTNQLGRYIEAAEEVLVEDALAANAAAAQEASSTAPQAQHQQRVPAPMASLSALISGSMMAHAAQMQQRRAAGGSSSSSGGPPSQLTFGGSSRRNGGGPFGWGGSGGSGSAPFASVSMGMGHASKVMLAALAGAAKAVPTSVGGRRLCRPSAARRAADRVLSRQQQQRRQQE